MAQKNKRPGRSPRSANKMLVCDGCHRSFMLNPILLECDDGEQVSSLKVFCSYSEIGVWLKTVPNYNISLRGTRDQLLEVA